MFSGHEGGSAAGSPVRDRRGAGAGAGTGGRPQAKDPVCNDPNRLKKDRNIKSEPAAKTKVI